MAKGSYLLRGKVGNTVKYRIANSNNKEEQGTRAYQAVVSNPQTTAQATQRMKLAAAVPFYRSLAGILDHSYQGVKYGGRSHAKFTQLALKMTSGIPFVERGNVNPVPGRYILSTGSLMPIPLTSAANDGFAMPCQLTEAADTTALHDGTITLGRLAECLIGQNPDLKDGDQLTFVICGAQLNSFNDMNENTLFSYTYARLVLDTTNTTALSAWQAANGIEFASATQWSMSFDLVGGGLLACAAAVIVSRIPATSSGAWQRSTTELTLAAKVSQVFMSEDRLAAVLPSYKSKSTTPSSTWYLNGGTADSTPASGGDESGGDDDEEDRP